MKRCPECRRDYFDDTLSFCLEDGAELVHGVSADEPATVILSDFGVSPSGGSSPQFGVPPSGGSSSTSAKVNTTDQTVALPSGSLTETTQRPTSSAEYLLGEARKNIRGFAIAIAILVLTAGGLGYWFFNMRLVPVESAPIASIAVLPFQNKSADANSEYLSDGLAESLIYRLTQLPNLKVSPTSSVLRYKGKDTDVAKIASELGVDAVMTGRLAQIGDNLTISVELVDMRNNKLLWGEQYDRKMSDLLATQREIATMIAQKLELKLSGSESTGITKKYTDSNEAYQLYMRGRYSFSKRTRDEMLHAVEYYQQAIKLDPKFALAHARISETYGSMPAYPYLSPKEAFPQAKAAAQKALEIDPLLAEAHTFLAYSLIIYDWNFAEGEREFKRAIELDPNNSAAHFRYGQIFLAPVGRVDEGLAEIQRGLDLEPLDINMGATLGWTYLAAGQNEKAYEYAKKTFDLEPTHPIARWMLSQTCITTGKYAEAIALDEQWLQTDPTNQFALRDAGVAYAKAGKRDKAEEIIGRYREIAKTQYVPACRIAAIYIALDEKAKAFEELDKSFEARDWELHRLNVDTYWIPFRGDPRFEEMVRRLNLPK